MNIDRISPATITLEDYTNLQQLLRGVQNDTKVVSVKRQLETEIHKNYSQILGQAVHETRKAMSREYNYEWTGPRTRFVVPLTIDAKTVDITTLGYTLTYVASIKNYSDWRCEYAGPTQS
jgi:hypothetical protein